MNTLLMCTKPWRELSLVAFDLETTGKYPLDSEICEVAAVRWSGGQVVDSFQSFIRPLRPMGEEVIAIHGITNEMVANAPLAEEVVRSFYDFVGQSVMVAHHAPFDMGFLAIEFERLGLAPLETPVLCSALLSRKALATSPNHRLQTLVKFLGLEMGQAHRALDDAKACLGVALKCLEVIGPRATLKQALDYQVKNLEWKNFSIESLKEIEHNFRLIRAIEGHSVVNLVYKGGSRPGQAREVCPIGIVRNPDGDFLVAREPSERQTKRYFLAQIENVEIV